MITDKNLIRDLDIRSKQYMSDKDLERYFPNNPDPNPIIKYNELSGLNSIYDILPNDGDFKIVLIEERQNRGHWTCVCRTKDNIIFFDSYSNKPDGQLKYIKAFWRKMLGEDKTHLTNLLNKVTDRKVIWSKNRFQSVKDGTATCGRWCILFLNMVLNFGYSLPEFERFIDKNREDLGLTRDQLVTLWIN